MWKPKNNLVGKKVNNVTVIGISEKKNFYLCRCVCGKEWDVHGMYLSFHPRKIISCGCKRKDTVYHTHGQTRGKISREYRAWTDIKTRCNNPHYKLFHLYGGRGIRVCDEWCNSFDQFLHDMGKCPPKFQIDRIDVNGNYEKNNCRWVSNRENSLNQRGTIYAVVQGQKRPLKVWAALLSISYNTLYEWLIRNKMSNEQFLNKIKERTNMACICKCGRPLDCEDTLCPVCAEFNGKEESLDAVFERAVTKFGSGPHTEDA